MKKELFDQLAASVREGGAILRGEVAPSRSFDIEATITDLRGTGRGGKPTRKPKAKQPGPMP